MRLEAAKYLYDVQSAAATLASFVEGRDWGSYQRDAMLRAAVERQFEIIGEALAQLGRRAPDVLAQIDDHRPAFLPPPHAGEGRGGGALRPNRANARFKPGLDATRP